MALTKTVTVPQTGETSESYQYVDLFQLRFRPGQQHFRMDTINYASKTAYGSNAVPLDGTTFVLPENGLPALDDQLRRLFKREDNTYVLESEKDNPEATSVIPTYAEVPPMMQFVMSIVAPPGGLPEGTPIFGLIMVAMYNLLATRPEFAGCKVVDI